MATSYKRKYSEVSDQLIRTASVLVHTLEENGQLRIELEREQCAVEELQSQVERLQSAATKQIEKVLSNEANSKPQKEAKSKGLAQQ